MERNAVRKLLTGPATAVRMSSRITFLKFRVSTGVGLAQPNGGKPRTIRIKGHQNCAERIDVDDRIQRNTPEHLGGRVAQAVGHPGVRRFVHANGEQQDDDFEEDIDWIQVRHS